MVINRTLPNLADIRSQVIHPILDKGCTLVFGAIVGSHAYGTNVIGSDVDFKWVFVQSARDFMLNGYREQIEISKDEVAYELRRFVELCKKANPTMLELLFTPNDCVVYEHDCWKLLNSARRCFLTKECRNSFGGYAVSQIEKANGLEKKMNWEKSRTERKVVLDFCYFVERQLDPKSGDKFQSYPIKEFFSDKQMEHMGLSAIPHMKHNYNLFFDSRHKFKGIADDDSNDIRLSDIPKDGHCVGMLYFNKDAYQMHCREYKEYKDWIEKRNTQRYVDVNNHGQMVDGKNLLHCVRLIETGLDLASFGELWIRRSNADFLVEIRQGKHDLFKIIEHSKRRLAQMEAEFKNSKLPDTFTSDLFIKTLSFRMREIVEESLNNQKKTQY